MRMGSAIARKFGVTPKAVRDIWIGKTWADATSMIDFETPCTKSEEPTNCQDRIKEIYGPCPHPKVEEVIHIAQDSLSPSSEHDSESDMVHYFPGACIPDFCFQFHECSDERFNPSLGCPFRVSDIAALFAVIVPSMHEVFEHVASALFPAAHARMWRTSSPCPISLSSTAGSAPTGDATQIGFSDGYPCAAAHGGAHWATDCCSYPGPSDPYLAASGLSQGCLGHQSARATAPRQFLDFVRFGSLCIRPLDGQIDNAADASTNFRFGSLNIYLSGATGECDAAARACCLQHKILHTSDGKSALQNWEEAFVASLFEGNASSHAFVNQICLPLPLITDRTSPQTSSGDWDGPIVPLPALDMLRILLSDMAQVNWRE